MKNFSSASLSFAGVPNLELKETPSTYIFFSWYFFSLLLKLGCLLFIYYLFIYLITTKRFEVIHNVYIGQKEKKISEEI